MAKDVLVFVLVTGGVLVLVALIVLPIAWMRANAALKGTHVSTFVQGKPCTDGVPCKSCVSRDGVMQCTPGICDATGNCLVPAQGNVSSPIPERGLRALVYS